MTILRKPRTIDTMSDTELNAKLKHSYEQSLAGEGMPFNEIFVNFYMNYFIWLANFYVVCHISIIQII